jgi:hypothetical protein
MTLNTGNGGATLDEEYYSYVRNEAAYNGKCLYQMGFWNALSLVLSHRAVSKIIHYGTFYHVIHFNPNAAEWIIFWLRGLHPNDELVGIEQGTESFVRELVCRLNSPAEPSASLHLNHRLTGLFPRPDGRILLEFKTGHTTVKVLAGHVVLALPRYPLMQLRPLLPGHIGELVDSVIPIPLVKCFLLMRIPGGMNPHLHRHELHPLQQGKSIILLGRIGTVNGEWSWFMATSPVCITGPHLYNKKSI